MFNFTLHVCAKGLLMAMLDITHFLRAVTPNLQSHFQTLPSSPDPTLISRPYPHLQTLPSSPDPTLISRPYPHLQTLPSSPDPTLISRPYPHLQTPPSLLQTPPSHRDYWMPSWLCQVSSLNYWTSQYLQYTSIFMVYSATCTSLASEPSEEVVSCPPRTHLPVKNSGEQSRTFWAYSLKWWKTNKIARSLIIT